MSRWGSRLKNVSAKENAGIVTDRHISDNWNNLISFSEELNNKLYVELEVLALFFSEAFHQTNTASSYHKNTNISLNILNPTL